MKKTLRTGGLLLAVATGALSTAAGAAVLQVCPAEAAEACDFKGNDGLQAAVDAAKDGDTIRVAAGTYVPQTYRDVAFSDQTDDLILRGYVVVAGKRVSIEGADGAVIDAKTGTPSIAFVLQDADVRISGLTIRDFTYAEKEDLIYDGHGLFAVNSRVRLEDITLERIIKMAITGRGVSLIDASDVRILDGHMGVWLEESAHARLQNIVIRGGDSAAIGAYMTASASLFNSVIDGNTDDGVYAKDHATIFVSNSLILNNKPIGVNATDMAVIHVAHSVVHGNEQAFSDTVITGEGVLFADPVVDAAYVPLAGSPLTGLSDPYLKRPVGLMHGDRP